MTGVAITGAGVVTPVAHSPAELHQALCEGGFAPRPWPAIAELQLPCHLGGAVDSNLLREQLHDRPLAGIDRAGQLTIVAAQRALASSVFTTPPEPLGLVLGTMFSGAHTISEFDRRAQTVGPACASPLDFANTVLNAAAGQAAIRLSLRGVNATIAGGHASGLQALAYGTDLVAGGRARALLAGGVEELGVESYIGFCRAGLMCGTNGRPGHVPVPFDTMRTGFALSEAAAFVILEPHDDARRRNAAIGATIAGHASLTDPDAIERGCCGRAAIADAIGAALSQAGISASGVDAVSAAANGSYGADEEEAAALADVFADRAVPVAVTAIKSVVGETLGASGPLQVIAMIEAMRDGHLPGIRGFRHAGACGRAGDLRAATRTMRIQTALVLSVSPDGGCCALVLRAAEEVR